jgi:sec-independent protein translocase protein TatC
MAVSRMANAAEGTFISHLLELRNRLLYALWGVAIVFAVAVFFADRLYQILAQPLIAVLPEGASMIATDPISPFLTPIKLSIAVSIVVAIPWILYQVWAFIAPGLYKNERRMVVPLIVSSTFLFYLGMAFAYFIVFPTAFKFLTGTAPVGVTVMTDMKAYMDFVYSLFFAFGVAFEIPVAVVLLVRLGVIKAQTLAAKRSYVVLWCFIVAAFLTPPDAISQIMLAVPMWMLFEVGLFFAHRITPRAEDEDADRALSDDDMESRLTEYERQNPADERPKD